MKPTPEAIAASNPFGVRLPAPPVLEPDDPVVEPGAATPDEDLVRHAHYAFLRDGDLVLVLDNGERVTALTADAVAAIVAARLGTSA